MKKLIVIGGPTASGKTALSIEIAKHLKTEIISADSRQIYKELTIGTAKPTAAQLAAVPHHFINKLAVNEEYNAGRFESDALRLSENLFRKYDAIVVTGGSGLYINALLYGFDDLPLSDPALRSQLTEEMNSGGIASLQEKIRQADPEYAKHADLNNPQRLIRALEVYILTGKPLSEHKSHSRKERPFAIEYYCIDIAREELYERINERVDTMFENGLVEEVASLLPQKNLNALQTVGYKEVFLHLDGKLSLDETISIVKQNTRNYAKRQLTWYRKNEDIIWQLPQELRNLYI